jgi:hypothetical protein
VSLRFEIEYVSRDRRTVLARQIDPGPFAWPSGTTLGEVAVAHVSVPRALDAVGRPRTDLFAFSLSGPLGLGLRAGQVVQLRPAAHLD